MLGNDVFSVSPSRHFTKFLIDLHLLVKEDIELLSTKMMRLFLLIIGTILLTLVQSKQDMIRGSQLRNVADVISNEQNLRVLSGKGSKGGKKSKGKGSKGEGSKGEGKGKGYYIPEDRCPMQADEDHENCGGGPCVCSCQLREGKGKGSKGKGKGSKGKGKDSKGKGKGYDDFHHPHDYGVTP